MKNLFCIISMMMLLSSCWYSKSNKFIKELESSTGDDFAIAKTYTIIEGYIVVYNRDEQVYTAYNLDKWEKGMSLDEYVSISIDTDIITDLTSFVEWEYRYVTDSVYVCHSDDCEWVTYGDWEWVPVTYYTDGEYTFEETIQNNKDLEKLGGKDFSTISKLNESLTTDFGLSEARAQVLSRLAFNYEKIRNTRELTTEDYNVIAKEALGIDLEDAKKLMFQSSKPIDLIEKAAKANDISPEHMKKVLESLL